MKNKKSAKQTLILIGKVGAIVSLVLLVFAAIGTFVGFLGLILSPFFNWTWLQDLIKNTASQNGYALNWDVTTLNVTDAEIVSLKTLLGGASSTVLLFFAHALFAHIEKEGTPFVDANVKLLVDIGIVALVQAIAVPLFISIVVNATGTAALFANSSASGVSFVLALFVFALSLVFKYGVELQKEADTTL